MKVLNMNIKSICIVDPGVRKRTINGVQSNLTDRLCANLMLGKGDTIVQLTRITEDKLSKDIIYKILKTVDVVIVVNDVGGYGLSSRFVLEYLPDSIPACANEFKLYFAYGALEDSTPEDSNNAMDKLEKLGFKLLNSPYGLSPVIVSRAFQFKHIKGE